MTLGLSTLIYTSMFYPSPTLVQNQFRKVYSKQMRVIHSNNLFPGSCANRKPTEIHLRYIHLNSMKLYVINSIINFFKDHDHLESMQVFICLNNLKAHSRNKHHSQNNVILNEQLITCLCPANMKASLGSMLRLSVSSD